jgi:chromosomal replication initiator protein
MTLPPRVRPVDYIITAVARSYGLRREDLLNRRGPREIFEPRQIAMYAAVELTGKNLSEIARVFDGRDHSTVCTGAIRGKALMLGDDGKAAKAKAVVAKIARDLDVANDVRDEVLGHLLCDAENPQKSGLFKVSAIANREGYTAVSPA